ncbi:MAG: hypothetical protein MMC33_000069 [Icmadophila ericetorum]|nr:hypothetical protein [Icmadophila ericetorum]
MPDSWGGGNPSLSSTSTRSSPDSPLLSQHQSSRKRSRLLGHHSTQSDGETALKTAAAQSVRQDLRTNLQGDWEWPIKSSPRASPRNRIDKDTKWRERELDTSSASSRTQTPDPYKFMSPDSLGEALLTDRRKRQQSMVEEMSWNEGLKSYVQRRNAWTGGLMLPRPSDFEMASLNPSGDFSLPLELQSQKNNPENDETHNTYTATQPIISQGADLIELVPLPKPLFPPDNSIRSSITPTTYPTIYSKVVVQNNTPTIPINLTDVTRAMVAGWKADGEWPPKPSVLEPSIGRRRYREAEEWLESQSVVNTSQEKTKGDMFGLATRGVGRMRRALGLKSDVASIAKMKDDGSTASSGPSRI